MFDIQFYFARRGCENFKTMTIKTFKVVHDEPNKPVYVMKVIDELQKNHKEIDNEVISGYMPELPNNPMCPVDSFREYLSHLNPDCESLWQPPITHPKTSVWYAKSTVGDHTISDFMKNLSKNAGLSCKYTNHDIRVTGLSILGRCNFSDQQLMAISGHKSVESLKIYKKVSANEKFMMGYTLGYALKNPEAIRMTENLPQIEFPEENIQPKSKKRHLELNQQTESTPLSQMQIEVVQPGSIIMPNTEDKNCVKNNNLVEIPDEYEMDLMALIADIQNDDMQEENQIVPLPNEHPQDPPQQQNRLINANTQINFTRNPEIPSFNNCKIGTINFNIIRK